MKTLTLIAALLMLASCGRADAPLTPSAAARQQAKENKQPAPEAPIKNRRNTGKRFILDGLLD